MTGWTPRVIARVIDAVAVKEDAAHYQDMPEPDMSYTEWLAWLAERGVQE